MRYEIFYRRKFSYKNIQIYSTSEHCVLKVQIKVPAQRNHYNQALNIILY